jgi:hypothetical protein
MYSSRGRSEFPPSFTFTRDTRGRDFFGEPDRRSQGERI